MLNQLSASATILTIESEGTYYTYYTYYADPAVGERTLGLDAEGVLVPG
jgi:hypothetical protein